MEIDDFETPRERAARWLQDSELGVVLTLVYVSVEQGSGNVELVFTTPLGEKVRRTTHLERAEYAFVYNAFKSGIKQFKYTKNAQGFRVPQAA